VQLKNKIGKELLGDTKDRRKELGCVVVDWICLVQDRVQWGTPKN
jgi:hypothetical protein